jgi:hypothetical protein
MKLERREKEQVRAAMAEFAAAYEKGQHEKMAGILAPEARLYLHSAGGIQEIKGAAAASQSLTSLKGHTQAKFGEAKIRFEANGAAWVEAKLERYEASDAAVYGMQGNSAKLGQMGAARLASEHAHASHVMQAQEVQPEKQGLITAELERHGEQWLVKQMYLKSE